MSGTKRFVEQRILKNRAQEAKEAELTQLLADNNVLRGHGDSERRVDNRRRVREAGQERQELFMDYMHTNAEQDKQRQMHMSQCEANLADELARRKAESMRQDMERRRICEGSEELRALKERLHAAKVNKERAMQLLETETRREGERIQEHVRAEYMENERLENQEFEYKLQAEKFRQRERVKDINQQQIAEKEDQRQEAMSEHLKEKAQVEDLVNKLAKEDLDEFNANEKKKRESRAALRQFIIDNQQKQQEAEQAEKDENARIERYAQEKRRKEEMLAQQEADKAAEKAKVLKAMLKQAERASKEKEELEQLRNDLHMEQAEANHKHKEEMAVKKKLDDKHDMKTAYHMQMAAKTEKAAFLKEEEDRLRDGLLKKFAEDDRIEQMNDQKRRRKVEEHKREAERLMQLRRDGFAAARDQERSQEQQRREEEAARQVVIESERQRLLKENAYELRDFLPKYTLAEKADYNFIFSDRLQPNTMPGKGGSLTPPKLDLSSARKGSLKTAGAGILTPRTGALTPRPASGTMTPRGGAAVLGPYPHSARA
jgi:hypothetical protein